MSALMCIRMDISAKMACLRLFVACLVILYNVPPIACDRRGDMIGCFSIPPITWPTYSGQSVTVCLKNCEELFYKYSLLSRGSVCHCGNTAGEIASNCNTPCLRNASQICGGDEASSVYDTNINFPGPPDEISISKLTDTSLNVQWREPKAHGFISKYVVGARPLHSFTDIALKPLEWDFSNNTFRAELPNLVPCTEYNVTVLAVGSKEFGIATFKVVETKIADPEPAPEVPVILERKINKLLVKILEAFNSNGPVTKYRIVVINENLKSAFVPEYLKAYNEALEEGFPYYITAEIDPEDIKQAFVIGDGRTYNGFYNAPLNSTNVRLSVGIVSSRNGITKIRYAESEQMLGSKTPANEADGPSAMVLGLGISVGVIICLIIGGLIILFVLRRRSILLSGDRLSQSIPLSEASSNVGNTGFLPEDEMIDYYCNMPLHSCNIPRNFLEVENSDIVGIGDFGQFVRGRVLHHGTKVPAIVNSIAEQSLEGEKKSQMLRDLDKLIKSSGHDNVIAMIGICRLPDTLYVVLEDTNFTLKDMLVSSRQIDTENNKFCTVSEKTILNICLGIARGMEFLASKNIVHTKLCCRNVAISDNSVPKIVGIGLSHIHPVDRKPDYTRWTAQEMFRQSRYFEHCDVWSFGCLLWEVFSLGATPYPNFETKDVPKCVLRGLRPAQLPYMGDDLYQHFLLCWQLDLEERPKFSQLVQTFKDMRMVSELELFNFTCYQNFNYQPYIPLFEIE